MWSDSLSAQYFFYFFWLKKFQLIFYAGWLIFCYIISQKQRTDSNLKNCNINKKNISKGKIYIFVRLRFVSNLQKKRNFVEKKCFVKLQDFDAFVPSTKKSSKLSVGLKINLGFKLTLSLIKNSSAQEYLWFNCTHKKFV